MRKHISPLIALSSLALCGGLLSGCAVAAGAGATAGVAAAQEGGLSRAKSDFVIQTEINDLWFKYDVKTFAKLDLTVNQGRVLITGVVQDPESRVEAVRLAWQPKGVKEVINEINVADSPGIVGFARDTWISGRLRTAITFDRQVQSINYNIDTVQGTVYLMGIAQSQQELNRVIEIARTIKDVKQVVSYVKFAGDDNVLNEGGYTPPAAQSTQQNSSANNLSSGQYDSDAAPGWVESSEPPVSEPYQPSGSGPTSLRPEDRIESEPLPSY